jgi:transposase
LAKVHHRVKDKRLDHFHKLSRHLVDHYDLICSEDLDRDLNSAINILRAGTARIAFGDDQLVEQAILFGKLAGINEEGSHVLKDMVVHQNSGFTRS